MACRITTILTIFLALLTRPHLVLGDIFQKNVTVDDTNGDQSTGAQVTYTPSENWSLGPSCPDCDAHPDPSQMLDGTWHDTTFIPGETQSQGLNASITFNGKLCSFIQYLHDDDLVRHRCSCVRFLCHFSLFGDTRWERGHDVLH